ncbi:TcpQ domain-containing protein [Paraburkholderia sp. RL17-337-BIB-A]|uniref:TcpQ domain-containing protein n=1 Tax=Paraburkholderia sp. RL17-337-BIB-A TaxID=3031636 RepID=UPI0038BBF578
MNIMPTRRRAALLAQVFASLTLTGLATASFATDPNQSQISPPAGDGWQLLSGTSAAPVTALAMGGPKSTTKPVAPSAMGAVTPPMLAATPSQAGQSPYAVAPVVLPGASGAAPGGVLTLAVTPQDINLRNALDRWLQQQGWQLAWKIDDDLPLEFNATFSGDFDSVLTQVMRATNHMRTPTRVCEHTNNVIRVVARAANCQD